MAATSTVDEILDRPRHRCHRGDPLTALRIVAATRASRCDPLRSPSMPSFVTAAVTEVLSERAGLQRVADRRRPGLRARPTWSGPSPQATWWC